MPPLARSRSRITAPAQAQPTSSNNPSERLLSRSHTLSPANLTSSEIDGAERDDIPQAAMATTTTTQRSYTRGRSDMSDQVDPDSGLGADDARSSSLSDVEDAQDDQAMTSPDPSTSRLNDGLEDDSEAETERLEQITPKPRRATLNDGKFSSGKISSALVRELDLDTDGEGEASPSSRARDGDFDDELDPLDSLASLATSVAEQAQRKRKRSSSDGSPLSDAMELDEPARKRNHAQNYQDEDGELAADADAVAEGEVLDTAEDEPTIEDEADSGGALPDGEDDNNVHSEVRAAKSSKGRKGKRKGKKVKEVDVDLAPANEEEAAAQEVEADDAGEAEAEAEVEAEAEEEESTNVDEELTKKKSAMDGLSELEKYFVAWRKSHLTVEIAEIEKEMSLLEGPIVQCKHPDFLARRSAIDHRREEKVTYENTLREFKRDQESVKLVANRLQIGSQYFQSVRQLRDTSLERCNNHFHAIQKDRRRWGADERNHLRMFVSDRKQQIVDQMKINREVSILAGVAKYHGFPAAPAMRPIKKDLADEDLREMGVTLQPVQRALQRQPALTDTTNAHTDRTEAAAEFYEQTPWANPLHPAHQQNATFSNFYGPPRTSSGAYATPVAQNRIPSGPNGSSSTIDALSNQNSSAVGPASYRPGEQPHAPEETPMPAFRRAGSGMSSVPTSITNRDGNVQDASQTPVSSKTFALHAESSVNQPFPTSALHTGEKPSESSTDRPPGILGQRPLQVGITGGRVGV